MSRKRTTTRQSKSEQRTAIYVAVISLIGTVIVALIGLLNARVPVEIPIQATQTAEAQMMPRKGAFFSQALTPNQVMFVSSGQLQIGDVYCGDHAEQICVLLYQATRPQTITVESLDPQHYFVEVKDDLSPQEILDNKLSSFWQPPNCSSGCQFATFLMFKDEQLIRQDAIYRP
jgi:hypothetical protein